MIELTREQAQAIVQKGEQPALVVNPQSQETFVLIRKDVYDAMQKWMGSLKRRWDNPGDDELTRTPS